MKSIRRGIIFLFMALALVPVFGASTARIRKVGKAPNFIVLSRDGSKAYVTSYADGRFLEVDLQRKAVSRNVVLGGSPLGFAIAHVENFALIACRDAGLTTIVDLNTFKIIADVKTGTMPNSVAVDPRGYFAYVVDSGRTSTGILHILDIRERSVTGTVRLGSSPFGVAVSPVSEQVFVLMGGTDEVWVIDPGKQAVVSKIPVGNGPDGIAVTPDGKRIFVANSRTGDLTVIDAETLQVQSTIPVGKMPFGVTVSPNGKQVFVVNTGSRTLTALPADLSSLSGEVFSIDKGSTDVTASPDGKTVYILSESENSIQILEL
jgi:YVTN family beta-propeller protein